MYMAAVSYRRQLHTRELMQFFLEDVLRLDVTDENISSILEAERNARDFESHATKTHQDFRISAYRTDRDREKLHKQILSELITLPQMEKDAEIDLGRGGAKPADPLAQSQAFVVSGAPASGKSGVASRLAKRSGAYILDSDYAKRKFPEYRQYACGASLLHEESDELIFGESNSLYEYCVYHHYNIVVPLVGRTEKSVRNICRQLTQTQYTVHLVNVRLDRFYCARRAYYRFLEEGRYVPLSYVFDEVGNAPERIFYILRLNGSEATGIASFAQISTDVPQGGTPKLIDATEGSPVRTLFLTEEAVSL